MTVSIVTPWLNHPELVDDYFSAISISSRETPELIIVDDGSDEPLSFAEIRFEENRGFCAANNAGLERATGDVVVFMNNDVAPLRVGWLDELLAELRPMTLVGPRIRNDLHGQVAGIRFPYLDGWLMVANTDEILRLGGWDERYDKAGPAYYSDNDLSLRARLAGITLREVRNVGIRHKVSQTTGGPSAETLRIARINYRIFAETVEEKLELELDVEDPFEQLEFRGEVVVAPVPGELP